MEVYERIHRMNIRGLICDLFCLRSGLSLSTFMQSELRTILNTSTYFSPSVTMYSWGFAGSRCSGFLFHWQRGKVTPSNLKSSQLHYLQFSGYQTKFKIQFVKIFEDLVGKSILESHEHLY